MKVALVHDYLNQLGGGERVLQVLMEMFPDAPIFTLLYDEAKTDGRFAGRVAQTSFLDIPFARNHHRLFIPLMPLAAKSINLGSEYDLIISDTAGFAKGVSYDKAHTKHISYIHTPLRYAWETGEYFGHSLKTRLFNFLFAPAFWYVRRFDRWAGQRPDVLLANSKFIAGKVRRYYNRAAQVVYPPVDTRQFYYDGAHKVGDYFLAAGRLMHYKRFDLIVDAFKQLGLPLIVVGAGPEEAALQKQAQGAGNITFRSYVKDENELRRLYAGARALIFPHVEDFGLVAAEAQACGMPVIALSQGGATEIIEDGTTGVLFSEQTIQGLSDAVKKFQTLSFDRAAIAKRASRFSKQAFENEFKVAINKLMAG